MRNTFIVGAILALLAIAGSVSAATFNVDVRSIQVTPSDPRVGDSLSIKTEFYVSGPTDPKVKLYLYVDGELMDTFTDFYDLGTQTHTFSSVNTGTLTSGTKSIVVEADVYDGSIITDTDDYLLSVFFREKYGDSPVHGLSITQMSYKNPALSGESVPVTVFVKNTGSLEEKDVRVIVRLGSELERSDFFSIKRGETVARTVYIKAPSASGTYTISMEAENRASDRVEGKIDVTSASLTMNYLAPAAALDEWITVSGYAFTGSNRPATSVSIYKDGQYYTAAYPDRSGYYSASLRFYSTGSHSVAVRLGDIERYAVVNVGAPAPQPIIYTPPVAQPGETVVVVKDGSVRVYSGGALVPVPTQTTTPPVVTNLSVSVNATPTHPYVSVVPSAKEMYADQYRANTMYVYVTNRLGKAGTFRVRSDFNQRMAFLPAPQEIADGETKTFTIIFNPGEEDVGMIAGSVQIYEGNDRIDSFPLNIFVVQKKIASVQPPSKFPSLALEYALVGVLVLIAAGLAAAYFRKPRPLEPKIMPFGVQKEVKARATTPMQRKINTRGIFRVPWENVIY